MKTRFGDNIKIALFNAAADVVTGRATFYLACGYRAEERGSL